MIKFTPLVKGAITGIVLAGAMLYFLLANTKPDSPILYLRYVIYAGGIAWTLWDYVRAGNDTTKFGGIFGQGFKCFVIVTLVMAIFTGIFTKMHPEFAEHDAALYKEYLVEKKEKTPSEIDQMVQTARSNYTASSIYTAIFGYLVIGTVFTAAGCVIILMRKK